MIADVASLDEYMRADALAAGRKGRFGLKAWLTSPLWRYMHIRLSGEELVDCWIWDCLIEGVRG